MTDKKLEIQLFELKKENFELGRVNCLLIQQAKILEDVNENLHSELEELKQLLLYERSK